ncbi:MAG: hypothetical protein ACP5D7_00350 [Limnospira sp.]
MKKPEQIFSQTYRRDESADRYAIEIAIDRYSDLFNEWDAAPFRRRELNPELETFLMSCSDEIPLRYAIGLYVTIPKAIKDERREEILREGIDNHFAYKIYVFRHKLNRSNRKALYCILGGCLLLGVAKILLISSNHLLPFIFEQGLIIGGWVFLWEAVSILFFGNSELYHEYQTYKRLRNMPVIFQVSESHH